MKWIAEGNKELVYLRVMRGQEPPCMIPVILLNTTGMSQAL